MNGPRPEGLPLSGSWDLTSAAPLTIGAALRSGSALLRPRAGGEARREALFLLSGLLELTPGQLLLQSEQPLAEGVRSEYQARLTRRLAGEPLQYIEGRAAFRQVSLRVDRSVLIPRPETEQLVEQVLEWCRGREALRALDLGAGSGAIAISLALEGPFAKVVGVDISAAALKLARVNAHETGANDRVELRQGSLFGPLRPGERFQVIVSNPPYVARGEQNSLPQEVRAWEPAVALYAGPTGLELVGPIVRGAPKYLEPGGLLALEVAPDQAERTAWLVGERGSFAEPRIIEDLAGQPRILLAERR